MTVPLARSSYNIPITLPPDETDAMTVDAGEPIRAEAQVRSDGLLLYVAGAIYEPGTSPLSLWVPNVAWHAPTRENVERMDEDAVAPMDLLEKYSVSFRPLQWCSNWCYRLIRRRIEGA